MTILVYGYVAMGLASHATRLWGDVLPWAAAQLLFRRVESRSDRRSAIGDQLCYAQGADQPGDSAAAGERGAGHVEAALVGGQRPVQRRKQSGARPSHLLIWSALFRSDCTLVRESSWIAVEQDTKNALRILNLAGIFYIVIGGLILGVLSSLLECSVYLLVTRVRAILEL